MASPPKFATGAERRQARSEAAIASNKRRTGMKYKQEIAIVEEEEITFSRKPQKVILTDEEQAKIDRMIDKRHDLKFESKVYKPGSAEFKRVAAQVTPIRNIRRTYAYQVNSEGF